MIDVPVGVRKRTGPRASLHLITADALRSAPRRSEKECNLIGFEAFYKWNGSSWGHLSSGEVEWFILGTSLIWSWTLEEFRSVLWIVIVLHGWVAVGTGRRWHDVCCTSVRETSRVTSAASRGVGDWIRGDTYGARRVLSCFKVTRGRRTALFALSASTDSGFPHRFWRLPRRSRRRRPRRPGVGPVAAWRPRRPRPASAVARPADGRVPVEYSARSGRPIGCSALRADPPRPPAGPALGGARRPEKRAAGVVCSFAPATSRTHGAL